LERICDEFIYDLRGELKFGFSIVHKRQRLLRTQYLNQSEAGNQEEKIMTLTQTVFVGSLALCALQGPSLAQVGQVPTPCGIPAFPNLTVATGQSALDPISGAPEIFFNPAFFNSLGINGPPMFRYMLAHECSHHLSGDIIAQHINPQGMLMINPQIELAADCRAAGYLKSQNDIQALQVAIQYWSLFGGNPTGPNYPTGYQRAQSMVQCSQ
jgi:hypothetical protein